MSLIRSIDDELAAMTTGIGQVLQTTVAADNAAAQIAARAAGSGFAGIAQAMARVRHAIKEVHARIASLGGSVHEARTPVAAASDQMSPQQTIAVLAPASEKITTIQGGIGAAIGKVHGVQQLTVAVLQGGQPGPMLARMDAVKQVLLAVAQRGNTARQHVETALTAARNTGDAGNH